MQQAWSTRILDFPVRAAAVDEFLRELRARGCGDLNAVLTTLNEGGLCRTAVQYWMQQGWIVAAPNTPLVALTGPGFDRAVSLRRFCGEATEAAELERAVEERSDDDDS